MRLTVVAIAGLLWIATSIAPAAAQQHKHKKPKSQITQLRQARKRNHTVRQITVDPKKSPGKHADNLSKNVNHETNRESKDFNHSMKKGSKAVNHSLNQFSKNVNHAFQGKHRK